jgi:hypothetical protein
MGTSRVYLFEDEIEQRLLEELTASDQSSFGDKSDSSGTDDLTVGEVIGAECSDNKSDDVQFATAYSAPSRNLMIIRVTMYNLLPCTVRLVLRVIRALYLSGRT